MDVDTLLEKIERLSVDKAFGMLTRNALEEKLNDKNKMFNCLFIDLCNMSNLNGLLGYEEVNRIIKEMFTELKESEEIIVGRWFSGDEIVIIAEDVSCILAKLKVCSRNHNISFKHKIFKRVTCIYDLKRRISKTICL